MSDKRGSDAPVEERRRHIRQSVHWSGSLTMAGEEQDCLVLDLSSAGARVQSSAPVPTLAQVQLKLRQGDSYLADIVWHQGSFMGLRFTDSPMA